MPTSHSQVAIWNIRETSRPVAQKPIAFPSSRPSSTIIETATMPVESMCVELIDHSFHIPRVIIYCSAVLGRIPTRRRQRRRWHLRIVFRRRHATSANTAPSFCPSVSNRKPILLLRGHATRWLVGRCLSGGTSVIGRIGPLSPRAHTSRRRTAGTNGLTSPGDLQSSRLISGSSVFRQEQGDKEKTIRKEVKAENRKLLSPVSGCMQLTRFLNQGEQKRKDNKEERIIFHAHS